MITSQILSIAASFKFTFKHVEAAAAWKGPVDDWMGHYDDRITEVKFPPQFKQATLAYRGMFLTKRDLDSLDKSLSFKKPTSWTKSLNTATMFGEMWEKEARKKGQKGSIIIFKKEIPSNKVIVDFDLLLKDKDFQKAVKKYGPDIDDDVIADGLDNLIDYDPELEIVVRPISVTKKDVITP